MNWFSIHVSGVVRLPPDHEYPVSILHSDEHPSKSNELPSSHSSVLFLFALPQLLIHSCGVNKFKSWSDHSQSGSKVQLFEQPSPL